MKKLCTIFFTLFVLLNSASAENSSASDSNVFASNVKSLFASHESVPSKVYVGQIFSIKLKAIIASNNFSDVVTLVPNASHVELINPDNKWESLGDKTYYNTLHFKVTSPNAIFPALTVSLLSNKEVIESQSITLPKLNIIQLKKDALFSNVIADSLTIKKYKTTSFDDKNIISVLEIEATNSNLKDFSLSSVPKNGVDSFSENGATQKIYYYAIVPNYQKTLEFTYFDLPSNKFVKNTLPLVVESDEVSTQLGLNPKESIFEFYKSISYAVLAFIFFLVFIRRRRFFYLLLMLLFLALYFLDKNPLNQVQLKANSSVMILPTEKSTIFFTNSKVLPVEKLGERDPYTKILLPDGKIGWTQNENIIKN